MNPDRNLKTLEEEWYRVLFDHFKAEIEDAALRGNKSVTLSWQTLAGYDIRTLLTSHCKSPTSHCLQQKRR